MFYRDIIQELQKAEMLEKHEVPGFLHSQYMTWFKKYATIGGMPEILNLYAQNADITELSPIYGNLIQSYMDDVEKYIDSASRYSISDM